MGICPTTWTDSKWRPVPSKRDSCLMPNLIGTYLCGVVLGLSRKRRPKTQKRRPLENEDLENEDPLENEDLENEDP